MYTFSNIFKNSFLDGFANVELSVYSISLALLITSLLALYIFFVYRVITRKTFYSKNFNIALAGVSVVTAAIILTVQSSVVISLGMVGALSIVRFRTAIKDPIDLMFLFWSISIGIICGAGLAIIAVILSIIMTIGIVVLNNIPSAKAPMILIVNSSNREIEDEVCNVVKKYSKHYQVKSRNIVNDREDLTIELRTANGKELVRDISSLNDVNSVSLLNHSGEVTV